jgi:hypothetical protein
MARKADDSTGVGRWLPTRWADPEQRGFVSGPNRGIIMTASACRFSIGGTMWLAFFSSLLHG